MYEDYDADDGRVQREREMRLWMKELEECYPSCGHLTMTGSCSLMLKEIVENSFGDKYYHYKACTKERCYYANL